MEGQGAGTGVLNALVNGETGVAGDATKSTETMEQFAARRTAETQGTAAADSAGGETEGAPAAGAEGEGTAQPGEEGAQAGAEGAGKSRTPRRALSRIDTLTKNLRETERENARLRGILEGKGIKVEEAAAGTSTDGSAAPETVKAAGDRVAEQFERDNPKPQRADFEDPDEFTVALAEWASYRTDAVNAARRLARGEVQQQAQAAAKHQETLNAMHETGRELFGDEYDDLVLNENLTITPAMAQGLVEATMADPEVGAHLAHYLASRPEEARRIAQLAPFRQAQEMGKLEAALAQDLDPKPQDTAQGGGAQAGAARQTARPAARTGQPQTGQPGTGTQRQMLPRPLRQVRGGGAPTTLESASSMEDYRKIRLQQRRAQLGLKE